MRIPISWLKEYIDTKLSVKEIADKLITSGTEIETITKIDIDPKVVVGEILEIEKHPNADRLQVTQTSVGKETLQIVCGATNIEVGQKVPVARIGAMIGDFEIKETELRGVKSSGMLCSESELELSDDHTGIMILDARAEAGKPVNDYLARDTAVLDAEITPNRGDCLSMIGIARELSAVSGGKLNLPNIRIEEVKERASDNISVEIKDKDLCNRYIGRVIKDVKIGPSPKWMRDRLSAVGVRPINNVVDVTNYVMFEMGQPLHAFDLGKIKSVKIFNFQFSTSKIIVRRAENGEEIETLDGVVRKLDSNDLIIADEKGPQAVAGVLGGKASEVTEKTTDILLESANFHPTAIRKTAQKLALRTEGSSRHEKGLPLRLAEEAADRAAGLIAEFAGGEVLSAAVCEGKKKDSGKKVTLEFSKIKSKLGVDISADKAVKYLERLGFAVSKKGKESAEFTVPYWRLDVSIEEDLLEEIARVYGYNNIPSTLPQGTLPVYEENKQVSLSNKIRQAMSAMGFFEAYSYSFASKEKACLYRKKDLVQVSNPLSREQEYMRADLVGSLLDASKKNKEYGQVRLYEISSVYFKEKAKITEKAKLSGLVSLKNGDAAADTVGAIRQLLNWLNIKSVAIKEMRTDVPFCQSAEIFSGKNKLGIVGLIPESQGGLMGRETSFFEIDMGALISAAQPKIFKGIPKFPGSERDLTFIVGKNVKVQDMEERIGGIASKIRAKAVVTDIYISRNLGENKKAVTVRFYYQAATRTLTDAEVDADQKQIMKVVKDSLGGEIKGERPEK